MRKLLFLAMLGGVAYGLRKLSEDTHRPLVYDMDEPGDRFQGTGASGPSGADRFGAMTGSGDRGTEDRSAEGRAEEDRLDKALRDSFPASDPPSMSR